MDDNTVAGAAQAPTPQQAPPPAQASASISSAPPPVTAPDDDVVFGAAPPQKTSPTPSSGSGGDDDVVFGAAPPRLATTNDYNNVVNNLPAETPGLISRTYEGTPLPGIVNLVKDTANYQPTKPIDLYHEAVRQAQLGNWSDAAEAASKLVSGGLFDKDHPIRKAAEEIIMHPIDELKEQYKEARKTGSNPVAAATAGPALIQGLQDVTKRIAEDRAAGNPVAAAADSSVALLKSHAIGGIPLIGGALQQMGTSLDEDLHNKNYSAVVGDILGPLLTLGTGKILGNLKDVEAESKINPNKLTRAAQTVKEANATANQALSKVQINQKLAKALDTGTSFERESNQALLDQAGNNIKATGENAPDNSLITHNTSDMVKNARKDLSSQYTTNIGQLRNLTEGQTVDYEGSPLHQSVLDTIGEGQAQGMPLDEALRKSRPGSPQMNATLENLSDLNPAEEAAPEAGPGAGGLLNEFINRGEEAAPAGEATATAEPEPTQLNLDDLVKTRHILGERMRNLGTLDSQSIADRNIYSRLIRGVDDTIEQLVNKVGQPEEGAEEGSAAAEGNPELARQARQLLDQTNAAYKEGIQRFDNTDVKALQNGNVNDVAARLMRGETSIEDINAVKATIGEDNFQRLGHDSLRRIVADSIDESGNMDYNKFFKTWKLIKPNVRVAMFGPNLATDLTDNLNIATRAMGKLTDINKMIADITTGGDESLAWAKDHAKVEALSQTIGPEAMRDLGNSILQQKFSEASQVLDPQTGQFVKTHFNPDVVLDWWNQLGESPEIRQKLFTIDEAGAAKYNKLMKNLSDVSSVKKLVKYGVLPAVFGGAGLIHSGLGALVAAVAGGGVEATFGSVRNILDSVANRPGTWKVLGGVGKGIDATRAGLKVATGVAKTGAQKAGQATKNTAPLIHRPLQLHKALQGTKSSLGEQK